MVVHKASGNLIIIENDHAAFTVKGKIERRKQLADVCNCFLKIFIDKLTAIQLFSDLWIIFELFIKASQLDQMVENDISSSVRLACLIHSPLTFRNSNLKFVLEQICVILVNSTITILGINGSSKGGRRSGPTSSQRNG